jgi:hypothetical protein
MSIMRGSPPVASPSSAPVFHVDPEQGIYDFLDAVCKYCKIVPDAKAVDSFARQMSENGFIFVKQLNEFPEDMLSILGLPENLVKPVSLAMKNQLTAVAAASLVVKQPPPVVSPKPVIGGGNPPPYQEVAKPKSPPKVDPVDQKWGPPIDPNGNDLPPYMGNLQPGESQASNDGLEFGTCKLCKDPFAEGAKEMLDCMHFVGCEILLYLYMCIDVLYRSVLSEVFGEVHFGES